MLYFKVAKKTYVGAIFLDSEGTLFSETFKVLVNKVHLEYQFSSSKYVFYHSNILLFQICDGNDLRILNF